MCNKSIEAVSGILYIMFMYAIEYLSLKNCPLSPVLHLELEEVEISSQK